MPITTIGTILDLLLNTTLSLIGIFEVLAVVAFFYGLALFLFNRESKTINERGKNIMVWGAVALFVMVSIWGIIGLLQNTFIGDGPGPARPEIRVPSFS
ncbi:hypothetical protein D4R99_02815 [bacterium]|nr:MAG: hypothetical protein D4R99_02815 [bacterium]